MKRMVNFSEHCTVLAKPGRTLPNCIDATRKARIKLWRSGINHTLTFTQHLHKTHNLNSYPSPSYRMLEARSYSAAASHPDYGWVITGGYDGGIKSTAEKTGNGRSFNTFPSLPVSLYSHCLVSLDGGNNGDFLLTGGWDKDLNDNKKTYIFREGEWRQVEDMPTARGSKKPN